MEATSLFCLSSDISPQIYDSPYPTLQKADTFLLVEIQIYILISRADFMGVQKWFDRYPSKFRGPLFLSHLASPSYKPYIYAILVNFSWNYDFICSLSLTFVCLDHSLSPLQF